MSMTAHPHITKMVGAPQGNLMGQALNPEQQRTILQTALEAVGSMTEPGTIMEYPDRWRGSLRSARAGKE